MQHARHCLELGAKSVEYKQTLEAMADNWARLAADRKARVTRGKRRSAPRRSEKAKSWATTKTTSWQNSQHNTRRSLAPKPTPRANSTFGMLADA